MKSGALHYDTTEPRTKGFDNDPGIAVAVAALTFVTCAAWLHPHPLVLPLLSILLVMAAFAMAAITAWRHRQASAPLMERLHLAGLVIFYGFAAAIIGDPDPAVRSLDAVR